MPGPSSLVAAPDSCSGLPAPTASPVWKAKHDPALSGGAAVEMMSGCIKPLSPESLMKLYSFRV